MNTNKLIPLQFVFSSNIVASGWFSYRYTQKTEFSRKRNRCVTEEGDGDRSICDDDIEGKTETDILR